MGENLESTETKRKLRFTILDDIILLKETISQNPYQYVKKWRVIHNNFTKAAKKYCTLRTMKDHVEYLLTLFRKEDFINLRRSGTEEMFRKKERLLQELLVLKGQFKPFNKINTTKTEGQMKDQATNTLQHSQDTGYFSSIFESEVEISSMPSSPSNSDTAFSYSPVEPEITLVEYDSATPEFMPSPSSLLITNITSLNKEVSAEEASTQTVDWNTPVCSKVAQKRTIAEILERKQNKELEVEEKKLALEEKRLAYDNRRLSLEEKKIELLQAMQQQNLVAQTQQQQLLTLLIEKLTKNKCNF